MPNPDAFEPYARLATGMAVLDAELRVVWLNDALAEILEVGVRSLRGQDFSALVGEPGFADQAARVLAGQPPVRMRAVTLHTLHGAVPARGHLDLQVHATAAAAAGGARAGEHAPGRDAALGHPARLRPRSEESARRPARRGATAAAAGRGPALADLAGMVIAEADRLATLADRLLRHGGRPQLGPVDMHAVLGRVEAVLDGQLQAPRTVRDYDPSLPACTGDADRLQQLLLNLARNAVRGRRTAP